MYKQVIDGVETRFIRDGYQIVQERDSSNAVTRSYVWDPTAPGGIGGLLEMKQKDTSAAWHYYSYYYDGRGNVSALTDENCNVVCEYRYEPFGGIIGRTLATGFIEQPYRFSTKYHYTSTGISNYGIVDYGYRFYVVSLGRWLTQDPIGEAGGVNLYGFVKNNSINLYDYLGLSTDPPTDQLSYEDFQEQLEKYAAEWNDNRKGSLKDWGQIHYFTDIDVEYNLWPPAANITGKSLDYYYDNHICSKYAQSLGDYIRKKFGKLSNLTINGAYSVDGIDNHTIVKVDYYNNTIYLDGWAYPTILGVKIWKEEPAPILGPELTF